MIWMERQIEGLRPPPIRTPTELFRVARRPRLICVVSNGAHFVRTTPPLQPLMVPRRGLGPQVLRRTAAQRSSGGLRGWCPLGVRLPCHGPIRSGVLIGLWRMEAWDRGLPRESAAGLDALEVSLQFGDGLGGVGLLGKIVGAGVRASVAGGAEASAGGKDKQDRPAAEATVGASESGGACRHVSYGMGPWNPE